MIFLNILWCHLGYNVVARTFRPFGKTRKLDPNDESQLEKMTT